MRINKDEVDDIVAKIGKNKVIGEVQEIEDFVQDQCFKNSNRLKADDAKNMLCPYTIFKSLKSSNGNKGPFIEKKSIKQKDHQNDGGNSVNEFLGKNKILLSYMFILDPLMTLYPNDTLESKLRNFKQYLCFNLDEGKQFYRKFGFSRKKNFISGQLKTEISHEHSDESISEETMSYLCKVSNIRLVIFNVDEMSRKQIDGISSLFDALTETHKINESSYFLQTCNKGKEKGLNTSLTRLEEKEIDKLAVNIYIEHIGLRKAKEGIRNMKVNDLRKMYQFIFGEEKSRNKKKDDLLRELEEKFDSI